MEVNNGVSVAPHSGLRDCPPVETVCVPEVNLPPTEPLAERYRDEIVWLRERYGQGATLAAACSGAMLFAEAGLLDGQEATIHWAWCDTLRLEEANQILEAGDQPVEEIAGEVGYEDAGYFSRLFRRKVSLTPAEYRRWFGSLRKVLQTAGQ